MRLRQKQGAGRPEMTVEELALLGQLEPLLNKIFCACLSGDRRTGAAGDKDVDVDYKNVVGIALQCERLDIIRQVLSQSSGSGSVDVEGASKGGSMGASGTLLRYVQHVTMESNLRLGFRNQVKFNLCIDDCFMILF